MLAKSFRAGPQYIAPYGAAPRSAYDRSTFM